MRGIKKAGILGMTAIASGVIGVLGPASVAGAHVCGDPGTYHNMPTPPGDTHNLDPDGDGIACEDPSVFHQPPPTEPPHPTEPPPPSTTVVPAPTPPPAPPAPATPVVAEPNFTG